MHPHLEDFFLRSPEWAAIRNHYQAKRTRLLEDYLARNPLKYGEEMFALQQRILEIDYLLAPGEGGLFHDLTKEQEQS